MSTGSFLIAVSPQYDGSVLKCSSRPSIFHLPSHGSRCSAGFPDTGAEKGASSGRKRERNTRQPTSLPAVVSDTPAGLASPSVAGAGGRDRGGREGGGVEGGGRGVENQGPTTSPHRSLHYYPTPSSSCHQSLLDHCIVITMSFIGSTVTF